MIRSLIKQSGIFVSTLALSKIVTTTIFIWLARALEPGDFGLIVYYFTTILVIASVAQMGLSYYFQKHATAESEESMLREIYNAHTWTLGIALGFSLLVFTSFKQFTPMQLMFWTVSFLAHAYSELTRGYYLKLKSPYIIGLKTMIEGLPIVIGLLVIGKSLTVDHVILLWTVGFSLGAIILVPRKALFPLTWLNPSRAIQTLKKSSPYALLIVTSLAYARGDQLIIKFSLNNAALGMYGVAYRFLESIAIIPSALSQNLFSLTSQKGIVSQTQLLKLVLLMLAVGGAIGGFFIFFAEPTIILLVGEKYLAATVPLQIFGVVMALFFVNAPFATHVQSSAIIKKFLPFGMANTIGNLALNVMFVPQYGIIAAALIMLLTEVTGLCINIYFSHRVFSHET